MLLKMRLQTKKIEVIKLKLKYKIYLPSSKEEELKQVTNEYELLQIYLKNSKILNNKFNSSNPNQKKFVLGFDPNTNQDNKSFSHNKRIDEIFVHKSTSHDNHIHPSFTLKYKKILSTPLIMYSKRFGQLRKIRENINNHLGTKRFQYFYRIKRS